METIAIIDALKHADAFQIVGLSPLLTSFENEWDEDHSIRFSWESGENGEVEIILIGSDHKHARILESGNLEVRDGLGQTWQIELWKMTKDQRQSAGLVVGSSPEDENVGPVVPENFGTLNVVVNITTREIRLRDNCGEILVSAGMKLLLEHWGAVTAFTYSTHKDNDSYPHISRKNVRKGLMGQFDLGIVEASNLFRFDVMKDRKPDQYERISLQVYIEPRGHREILQQMLREMLDSYDDWAPELYAERIFSSFTNIHEYLRVGDDHYTSDIPF
jgi:hypothetical protein